MRGNKEILMILHETLRFPPFLGKSLSSKEVREEKQGIRRSLGEELREHRLRSRTISAAARNFKAAEQVIQALLGCLIPVLCAFPLYLVALLSANESAPGSVIRLLATAALLIPTLPAGPGP